MGVMICLGQGGLHSPSVSSRPRGRSMFHKHLLSHLKRLYTVLARVALYYLLGKGGYVFGSVG